MGLRIAQVILMCSLSQHPVPLFSRKNVAVTHKLTFEIAYSTSPQSPPTQNVQK